MSAAFSLENTVAILQRTPATLSALLAGLPDPWIRSTEGEGTWSPYEVVGHLDHAERTNWIPRIRHLLSQPDQPFPPFDRAGHRVADPQRPLTEILASFAQRREESLVTLAGLHLAPADVTRPGVHPQFGPVTLGNLLASWAVHDLEHLGQITRTMSRMYGGDVGPWRAVFRSLRAI